MVPSSPALPIPVSLRLCWELCMVTESFCSACLTGGYLKMITSDLEPSPALQLWRSDSCGEATFTWRKHYTVCTLFPPALAAQLQTLFAAVNYMKHRAQSTIQFVCPHNFSLEWRFFCMCVITHPLLYPSISLDMSSSSIKVV